MFDIIRAGKKALSAIGRKIIKEKPKFSKRNIERYIPKQLKIRTKRSKKGIGKTVAAAISIGVGIVGVLAGIGIARIIRNKITKKAVILVGANKNELPGGGFNGYLVKYTDLDGLDALVEKLAQDEFSELILVPMNVINGYETEKIRNIMAYKKYMFESVKFAPALLSSDADYTYVAKTLAACTAGTDIDTAVVFLGKGTTHYSNSSYIALNERLKELGVSNVFVGTLHSYPGIDKVMSEIESGKYQNVILCPLEMTVDAEMCAAMSRDNEASWYNAFSGAGFNCGAYYKGLCAYRGIRRLIVEHTKSVMR